MALILRVPHGKKRLPGLGSTVCTSTPASAVMEISKCCWYQWCKIQQKYTAQFIAIFAFVTAGVFCYR